MVVPCYLMIVVLLAYFSYAALSVYLTPPFDSPELITGQSMNHSLHRRLTSPDRHCNIPPRQAGEDAYYWKFAERDSIPEAVDLPLDLVNRVLYPARKRPI